MATLKKLATLVVGPNRDSFDYVKYKYEEIQSTWIIHEGYLKYLADKSLFGQSICMFWESISIETIDLKFQLRLTSWFWHEFP